jgi:hypothetical protein
LPREINFARGYGVPYPPASRCAIVLPLLGWAHNPRKLFTAKDAKETNAKVNPDAITRLVIFMTTLVLCFPSRPLRPWRFKCWI